MRNISVCFLVRISNIVIRITLPVVDREVIITSIVPRITRSIVDRVVLSSSNEPHSIVPWLLSCPKDGAILLLEAINVQSQLFSLLVTHALLRTLVVLSGIIELTIAMITRCSRSLRRAVVTIFFAHQ